jgi:hypothetical protein
VLEASHKNAEDVSHHEPWGTQGDDVSDDVVHSEADQILRQRSSYAGCESAWGPVAEPSY